MTLQRDDSGRLHIHSSLMGESLMDKSVLASTDTDPIYRPMPDLIVVKIGGQSIIDRGRSALLPILDELVEIHRSPQPLLIATGGGTRARHAYAIATDLGMPTGVLARLGSSISEQNALMVALLLSQHGGIKIGHDDLPKLAAYMALGSLPVIHAMPPYGLFERPPALGRIPPHRTDAGTFLLAMVAKGQAIPAYDPRGMKGMGLGYATSNRGACHLRGYTPASELGLIPLKTDPLAWQGKGELTKILQDLFAFMDSLDVCKFSSFAEGPEEFAAQYRAFLGLDNFTGADVMKAGERIYNLERYYNNLVGFREGSDTLPKRFLEEPSTMPGSEGQVCELDKMLEEYYEKRGWINGVTPEEKLKELEIIG